MEVDDELLSDEGLLQINDDGATNQSNSSSAVVFQMNYFICPPPPNQFVETNPRLLPVSIDLPPPVDVKMEICDQDPVTQVFFTKMRETEFVDMKVDSPKPSAVVPQNESNFKFEEEKGEIDSEMDGERNFEGGGANAWKWSLNGIGAICSFGVAAATFCIIVFTTTNNNKHHHRYSQKLHFRIYSDDKRMKAIDGVSGVPITRARITVGGYYDGSR